MLKVLLAWELGSGLGHLGPLRAIALELLRRKHQVTIAANNTALCRQGFAGTGVEVLPTPVLPPSAKRLKIPCTYSDILHDCGYSSAEEVSRAAAEWLLLFDRQSPDLLLCDHSPTALLASRVRGFTVATVGTGFVCPPDVSPLPSLHSDITEPHWAAEVEQTVLDNMNTALATIGGESLSRITQIFGEVSHQYLLTFKQLDHYGKWRSPGSTKHSYRQSIGMLPGLRVSWPTGSSVAPESPRVFVYLRGDPSVVPILQGLAFKRIATVCCAPHLIAAERESFAESSVTVISSPVDLTPLLHDCDVAVLNGGHGTVSTFLQAGVPMLILPLMLEQQVTANRLVELGVGLQAPPSDLNAIGTALVLLLENPSFKESARNISQQIPVCDEADSVTRLVDSIQELFPGSD